MGGFYGSVQLRCEDRPRVLAAAEAVAVSSGIKCLAGPVLNGWVGVYPENSGQDETVGQQIAERVGGYAVHLLVHDDDILAYWLWSDGKLIDRYHSSPGYFGEENRAAEEPLVGDAKHFAFVLNDAEQAKLTKLLDRDGKEVFEVERLRRLGRLLRIENALTSYEYWKEGDGSPVKGRRQFVEFPADDSAAKEKSARATAAKQIRDERKRLKSAGILLLQLDRASLHGGATAIAGGFIRFPAPHYHEQPSSLEFHSAPWKTPSSVGFDLPPKSNPFNVVADSSGHWVAAQADCAIRIWEWDGTNARHVVDIPTEPFSFVLAVSVDGKLIARTVRAGTDSDRQIAVHDVASVREVAKISVDNFNGAAFGPDGKSFAVASGAVEWVDLSDLSSRRRFEIGAVVPGSALTDAEKAHSIQVAAALVKKIEAVQKEMATLDAMRINGKPLAEKDTIQTRVWTESMVTRLQKQLRDLQDGKHPYAQPVPAERVSHVGFSRDGRWLWCGSDRGFRVFEVSAIASRTTAVPTPVRTAKPPTNSEYANVYSIVEEVSGAAVLFAGVGGHVLRLDLESGAVRSLVQVPGATFITGLAMSPDGRHLSVSSTDNRVGGRKLSCWFEVWDYVRLFDRFN